MLIHSFLKLAMLGAEWVMYLLIGLSILSIGAMLERWFFYRRSRGDVDALGESLLAALEAGNPRPADELLGGSRMIEAGVIRPALRWLDGGPAALAAAVDAELAKRRRQLERGMNVLGTIGSNGPFVGLFGTVIGVIEAFAHLGTGTDKEAMGNVMAGIAEALVATAVGLLVAIPAVVAYNHFQKKNAEIEDGVQALSKQLAALLEARDHHAARGHRAAGAANRDLPVEALPLHAIEA